MAKKWGQLFVFVQHTVKTTLEKIIVSFQVPFKSKVYSHLNALLCRGYVSSPCLLAILPRQWIIVGIWDVVILVSICRLFDGKIWKESASKEKNIFLQKSTICKDVSYLETRMEYIFVFPPKQNWEASANSLNIFGRLLVFLSGTVQTFRTSSWKLKIIPYAFLNQRHL